MRNKKLVIIILSILIFIMTISGIVFNQTLKNIQLYGDSKAYEDLSYLEKTVASIEGYTFYTREQLRDKEAQKIVIILKKIGNLTQLYDKNNKTIVSEEIKQCDSILDELHKENSSGNISDDSLRTIIDNSISAVENHKSSLNAFKNGDLNTFSEFAKKSDENALKVRNEMERLGFTK